MKHLSPILLAIALIAGLAILAPSPAAANPWCSQCVDTGLCFPCCMCMGHGPGLCSYMCDGLIPLADSGEGDDASMDPLFQSPWSELLSGQTLGESTGCPTLAVKESETESDAPPAEPTN